MSPESSKKKVHSNWGPSILAPNTGVKMPAMFFANNGAQMPIMFQEARPERSELSLEEQTSAILALLHNTRDEQTH